MSEQGEKMTKDLEKVQSKIWRSVYNRRRARRLAKRGEYIYWSMELDCWIWRPDWHGLSL